MDSRGNDTIEVDVRVNGFLGRACSPTGSSVGKLEAPSFPSGGACASSKLIDEYSSKLLGINATDYSTVAKTLRDIDGTKNYSNIGGSAAYGITIASMEAASKAMKTPLFKLMEHKESPCMPFPLGNVLGGGMHGGPGAPEIQEFLVCPIGAKDIITALKTNSVVHKKLRENIELFDPEFTGGKGDEGSWVPRASNEDALRLVSKTVQSVSNELGIEIKIGLDLASSSIWNQEENAYVYYKSGVKKTIDEQIDLIIEIVQKYDIFYIEDPFHEDDYNSFAIVTEKLKNSFVTGDDLFVTNTERLLAGIRKNACNSAILKVNQVGSLGDALVFAKTAEMHNYLVVASHRSGESVDNHLAHIAIGSAAKMIKSGVVGGERISKLNELLRIDEWYYEHEGSHMPMVKINELAKIIN